ncbi:hypothetical protein LXL04_020326 [Taraxacum kok-saghyz]
MIVNLQLIVNATVTNEIVSYLLEKGDTFGTSVVNQQGYFWKTDAVWGCLGLTLLMRFRIWLHFLVSLLNLITFLYRDEGLLRDQPNLNC